MEQEAAITQAGDGARFSLPRHQRASSWRTAKASSLLGRRWQRFSLPALTWELVVPGKEGFPAWLLQGEAWDRLDALGAGTRWAAPRPWLCPAPSSPGEAAASYVSAKISLPHQHISREFPVLKKPAIVSGFLENRAHKKEIKAKKKNLSYSIMVGTCTANCVLITRDKLYPQKVQNNNTVRWKRASQLILLLACRARSLTKAWGRGEPLKTDCQGFQEPHL